MSVPTTLSSLVRGLLWLLAERMEEPVLTREGVPGGRHIQGAVAAHAEPAERTWVMGRPAAP